MNRFMEVAMKPGQLTGNVMKSFKINGRRDKICSSFMEKR